MGSVYCVICAAVQGSGFLPHTQARYWGQTLMMMGIEAVLHFMGPVVAAKALQAVIAAALVEVLAYFTMVPHSLTRAMGDGTQRCATAAGS